jgi:hypothetical protein
MLIVVLWSAATEPYAAAFGDRYSSWLNWSVDVVFWIDILLSLNTGFEVEDGADVTFRRAAVLQRWLLDWNGATVDVLACIPWDSVVGLFEPDQLRVAFYRLLRILRVLRLLRAPRLITRLTVSRPPIAPLRRHTATTPRANAAESDTWDTPVKCAHRSNELDLKQ